MSPREEAIAVILLRRWLAFIEAMHAGRVGADVGEVIEAADSLAELRNQTKAFLAGQGASK